MNSIIIFQLNSKIRDTLQDSIEEDYRGLDKTDSYSVAWNYFMLKVSHISKSQDHY